MNKKILFSPVGGTDPISQKNYYEGALMQIARYWKPHIICLYMSKEILDNQREDKEPGRYHYCLKQLENQIGCKFDVYDIERENLTEVQLFNPIYQDFEEILEEFQDKMDESDELLLNISSGTPAMKSALLVLTTMIDLTCKCIQVDTPDKKMNEHRHEGDWTLEDFWRFDSDNDPDHGNRTHAEELPSLKLLKDEDNIKKLIDEYDYEAALTLAKSLRTKDISSYVDKLELASARIQLNFDKVDDMVKQQNRSIYCPIGTHHNHARDIYEYILTLQVKVERKEYADFLRSLTPVIVYIFIGILERNTRNTSTPFDSENYIQFNEDSLNWKNLDGTEYLNELNTAYNNDFKGRYVQSDHLLKLIESHINDSRIVNCALQLRNIEGTVRNIAEHNIKCIKDEWIKEETGFNSEDIIDLIHEAVSYTPLEWNIPSDSELWDSYNKMNEDIKEAI